MTPRRLFDRNQIDRMRLRATRTGFVDFAQKLAADEIKDRLEEVNKRFGNPVIVGWRAADWADWIGLDARLVPDGETLDLDEEAHDLAIHAFGLHWAEDPVGQLVQMRRALRPDGLMIAAFPGGETLRELRAALAAAEAELTGGLSPRVAPMAALGDLGGLLQRAGFAMPVADATRTIVTYETPLKLMRELRQMGEGNALQDRSRLPLTRGVLDRAAEIYAEAFAGDRIEASLELVFLTGWAPAEGQQKPLRPGSASARLADALGAVERKL